MRTPRPSVCLTLAAIVAGVAVAGSGIGCVVSPQAEVDASVSSTGAGQGGGSGQQAGSGSSSPGSGGTGGNSGGSGQGVPPNSGTTLDATLPSDAGTRGDSFVQPRVDSALDPDLSCYGLLAAACVQCCDQHHPSGSTIYTTAFDDCFCAPPNGVSGLCQTPCAQSDCSSALDAAPSMTGDPCDLCEQQYLADGGTCATRINAACQPTPDCVIYDHCISLCP